MGLFDNPFGDEKYQAGDPPPAGAQGPEAIISADTRREHRMPSGQSRTRRWPVIDFKLKIFATNVHES